MHLTNRSEGIDREKIPDLNLSPPEDSYYLPRALKRKKIQKICKEKNKLVFGHNNSDNIENHSSDRGSASCNNSDKGATDLEQSSKGI